MHGNGVVPECLLGETFRVSQKAKDDFMFAFVRCGQENALLGDESAIAVGWVVTENLPVFDKHDAFQFLAFDPLASC